MSKQSGEFGRRMVTRPVQVAAAAASSPLARQAGGVLIGVVIAFALGAAGVFTMKYAGRLLNQSFVERAMPGAPQNAIKHIKDAEANLIAIQQGCTQQSKAAQLTKAQKEATEGFMELYAGESELAEAAAFIECLAVIRATRFCQAPHKKHLVEALRQYAKLNRQMLEAWWIATGGSAGIQKATLMGTPFRPEQRARLGMPSAVMSPSMVSALRALAADSLVTINDLAPLTGNGVPPQLKEALTNVQPKKAICG